MNQAHHDSEAGGELARLRRWLTRHQALLSWSAITIGALLVVVLGAIGFERHEEARRAAGEADAYTWTTRLYMSVQLLFLNSGDLAGGIPWQLELARIAGVAVACGVIAKGFAGIFRVELARQRLRRLSDHCVVCGLGRKGLQLTQDLVRFGPVVVIDRPENQAALSTCQDLGAVPIAGDCTAREVQTYAGVARAARLIVTCGDDDTNIETVLTARDLAYEHQPRSDPLRVYVHVFSPRLQQFLRRGAAIADPGRRVRVTVFDTFENAARLALQANPLDWKPIARTDRTRVHLVVFGVQRLGSSLALQAAKIGHFANGLPIRITLVDSETTLARFDPRPRYPGLVQVCEVETIAADAESFVRSSEFAAMVAAPDQLMTLALCLRSGRNVLQTALAMPSTVAARDIPVLARLTEYSGLGRLIGREHRAAGLELRPIGMLAESCSVDSVVDARLDQLAQHIHGIYLAAELHNGRRMGETPALCTWDELDEEFKDSCRHQADHIDVKLRAVGCLRGFRGSQKRTPAAGFSAEQIGLLAEMEHARWCAERRLSGWTHGPERDDARKLHPDLVPWSALAEARRDIDRRMVEGIRDMLGKVEEEIYAAPQTQ